MRKVTPYLGVLVVIVSIGGLWYPKLGYFLILVFATLMLVSPFKGRWFCGNLCPRGSFNDYWIMRITRKKNIPLFIRSMWFRIPVFVLMMSFMVFRIVKASGAVDKIGMVFVTMCLVTTLIAVVSGILIHPRTWCSFCPMGTLQSWFGATRYQLSVQDNCVNCRKCHKVCPMQLKANETPEDPDCIKCSRCVEACPKEALIFD